jgi:hypothetical protein
MYADFNNMLLTTLKEIFLNMNEYTPEEEQTTSVYHNSTSYYRYPKSLFLQKNLN